MAKKDISEKILFAHNDVFADVVNVLLFGGKERVRPEELVDAQPTSAFKADGKLREQERDVAKFWKRREIRIAFIGLENQTKIDRTMPIRVMNYDSSAYKTQLLDKRQKQFYPVITLVLYLGHRHHWKKPRSLYEAVVVPDELKPFTSDYKINVFEVAFLEKDAIMKFKSDFKILAEYLYQMRTDKYYHPSNDEIKHVEEVIQMMSAMTGDDRFSEAYDEWKISNTRRMKNMCEALDIIENRGIAIGEKRGKERGRLETAHNAARKLKARNMPLSDIADITGLSPQEVAAL